MQNGGERVFGMNKTQDLSESLSCFMDGELSDHSAILDKLNHCNETKSCWFRYHVIRDTLRDSRPASLSADFSTRVMQALASEPTVLNPRFSHYRASFRRHMFKPVAGLAIAASVAAITVFTMQTFYMPDSGLNVASNTSPAYTIAAASSDDTSATHLPVTASDKQYDDDLNSYLLEHMEHSEAGSVQSMMPYVRLTGFEDSQ
jgi:sigma-E factor negative regulatory protein RseA